MMSMMAINLLMFNISPGYSSFGNQVYLPDEANSTLTQCDLGSPKSEFPEPQALIECRFLIDDLHPLTVIYFALAECTETRSSYLVETYFYHGLPYVGIGLFFSTWLVALFFFLALIYSVCRSAKKRTFNEIDGQDFEDES